MKEETHQVPKKNSFQLELEAKMKERHARGLTTALSPSPTDFNQDSIVISDGEDDILTSFQQNYFKSTPGYKSKWNSSHLNETMQWGDSQFWNPSFLHKDDKISDTLGIRNRERKESSKSGESQKEYLKSNLSSQSDMEIDSLQSPRNFKESFNKLNIKDSSKSDYKPERKPNSLSDYVDDSPRFTSFVIDQSLPSVDDAYNTALASSEQRFLKSSKKVKSVSSEKNEEKSIQDETNSPRPVPSVRKKSLTSPRYLQSQFQTDENVTSVMNNDSDPQNNGLSSARIRRHASKASTPSPVLQDNLNLSSGKNSPRTFDMKKAESIKTLKDNDISISESEAMKSVHTLGNKHSENTKDKSKNDLELEEKKIKKKRREKSHSLDRQLIQKDNIANKTFSVDKESTEDKSDDIKTSFSRRGSLQMQNKIDESEDKSKLNFPTQAISPKKNSVFDFLTEDIVEPKTKILQQRSLENQEQFSPSVIDPSVGGVFDKDTSSLCEESLTESRPTPTPRKHKSQQTPENGKVKTERQVYEEAIKQVEDFQKSHTQLFSQEIDKITNSKRILKPKPTSKMIAKNLENKSAEMLDTKLLREEIFEEWKTEKNKLMKEHKKKKIEDEEKKKKELEDKKKDAAASFESWKKQKKPILKQKLKTEKTKKEKEIEKLQETLEKKQQAAKLYEIWKNKKDELLKKEYSVKREEEQKINKLLSSKKEEKQKQNVSSFNTWKQTKDEILLQKKKEEMEITRLMKKQQNYTKIQKETLSEESYQQWLWRKEEQLKQEVKKKELHHLKYFYDSEPQQVWRPPSRTIPFN